MGLALKILLAASVAATFHALALIVATRLMVEVRVPYRSALAIVAIEYAAVAVLAGLMIAGDLGARSLVIVLCSFVYLGVGAVLLGRRIRFAEGDLLGIGNGVLIQAIQIPLIIPVLVVGSFLA
jgi:hypothetical protein